jgi:serine/threonine protein kinase
LSVENRARDATLPTATAPGSHTASAPTPPQLQTGELVGGRYEVVTLVGVGGFGEVYEVIDGQAPDVPLALKLHHIGRIRRRALDALRAEFALLASLAHPNLARVYDFSMSSTGSGFFTQELIRGPTLAGALDLTTAKGVELLAQVLRALDFLHARGIVHGDVKPSNILIDAKRQRAVMLDFGVTRPLGESAADLRGSPTFMSPELIQGWTLDGRTDLYSLGVTLYRLLTGGVSVRWPHRRRDLRRSPSWSVRTDSHGATRHRRVGTPSYCPKPRGPPQLRAGSPGGAW